MALDDLSSTYPGRAEAPSASYPQGRIRNATSDVSGDGTPVDEQWANDVQGFLSALLAAGEVSPSGSPDTALASDFLTALTSHIEKSTGLPSLLWQGQEGNVLATAASADGQTIDALTSSTIAYYEANAEELKTYSWDGTDWSQVGNLLSLTGGGTGFLTALDATEVAITLGDELRTYSWDGTDWSQAGNSLVVSGAGLDTLRLVALSATEVALSVSAADELRTYSWDGTDWSQVGNSLNLAVFAGTAGLARLASGDLAFINSVERQLKTYSWDGTDWSQVGNSLAVGGTGITRMTTLNEDLVCLYAPGLVGIENYAWDGTDWFLVGDVQTVLGTPSSGDLATLSIGTVAFVTDGNEELATYRAIPILERV